MAIHSNLDFELSFIHEFQDGTEEKISVKDFVKDVREWNEEIHSYAIIREQLNLKLVFLSEEQDATCTMDGFDILSDSLLKYDSKNNPYISPTTLTLFEYESSGYYPYIPGVYGITIKIGGTTYYSFAKVSANRLTDDQLKMMQEEVEEKVAGLGLDAVRKKNVYEHVEGWKLDPSLMKSFKKLDDASVDIKTIVSDLSKRVRSSVKKEYTLQPVVKGGQIDQASIEYRLKHPESTNYLKAKKNLIDYNLPENQMMKKIITQWIKLLDEVIEQVQEQLDQFRKRSDELFSSYLNNGRRKSLVAELEYYDQKAVQLKAILQNLCTNYWYDEISTSPIKGIPKAMYVDVRYRKLLYIHRSVSESEHTGDFHAAWKFQWKRTDQLYELWTFLKVIQTFEDNGFILEEDTRRFFEDISNDSFAVPTIPKGMIFQLNLQDIRLAIFYDHEIQTEKKGTNGKYDPIYTTSTRNCPDIRVDVFIRDVYIGTIIMDAKYRKKQVLMDSNQQLMSYVDHVRSPYILNKRRWEKIRPVHRVLVLYPEKWGDQSIERLDDQSISLIPLTPQMDHSLFARVLDELIEELLQDAEDEGIRVR